MKKYHRITHDERIRLETLYNSGHPVKEIAEVLGFSQVSIYRELKAGAYQHKNTDWTYSKKYSAYIGEQRMLFNRTTKCPPIKAEKDHAFFTTIERLILEEKLSPGAALAKIKREHIPVTHVCKATLYSYISKGLFLHVTNKELPYRGNRKKKHRKVREAKRPSFGTSITERPKEIWDRYTFGHWEMDTVVGKRKKGQTLLCLTERKTRYEIILRSKDKSAASTVSLLNGLERRFGKAFPLLFRSITVDNGSEFSDVAGLEKSSKSKKNRTKVYYCHPFCSSERGSNENQNRIIRRFIRKGTEISGYTNVYIRWTQDYLNNLPRAIFGYETSSDRLRQELQKINAENFFELFLF